METDRPVLMYDSGRNDRPHGYCFCNYRFLAVGLIFYMRDPFRAEAALYLFILLETPMVQFVM